VPLPTPERKQLDTAETASPSSSSSPLPAAALAAVAVERSAAADEVAADPAAAAAAHSTAPAAIVASRDTAASEDPASASAAVAASISPAVPPAAKAKLTGGSAVQEADTMDEVIKVVDESPAVEVVYPIERVAVTSFGPTKKVATHCLYLKVLERLFPQMPPQQTSTLSAAAIAAKSKEAGFGVSAAVAEVRGGTDDTSLAAGVQKTTLDPTLALQALLQRVAIDKVAYKKQRARVRHAQKSQRRAERAEKGSSLSRKQKREGDRRVAGWRNRSLDHRSETEAGQARRHGRNGAGAGNYGGKTGDRDAENTGIAAAAAGMQRTADGEEGGAQVADAKASKRRRLTRESKSGSKGNLGAKGNFPAGNGTTEETREEPGGFGADEGDRLWVPLPGYARHCRCTLKPHLRPVFEDCGFEVRPVLQPHQLETLFRWCGVPGSHSVPPSASASAATGLTARPSIIKLQPTAKPVAVDEAMVSLAAGVTSPSTTAASLAAVEGDMGTAVAAKKQKRQSTRRRGVSGEVPPVAKTLTTNGAGQSSDIATAASTTTTATAVSGKKQRKQKQKRQHTTAAQALSLDGTGRRPLYIALALQPLSVGGKGKGKRSSRRAYGSSTVVSHGITQKAGTEIAGANAVIAGDHAPAAAIASPIAATGDVAKEAKAGSKKSESVARTSAKPQIKGIVGDSKQGSQRRTRSARMTRSQRQTRRMSKASEAEKKAAAASGAAIESPAEVKAKSPPLVAAKAATKDKMDQAASDECGSRDKASSALSPEATASAAAAASGAHAAVVLLSLGVSLPDGAGRVLNIVDVRVRRDLLRLLPSPREMGSEQAVAASPSPSASSPVPCTPHEASATGIASQPAFDRICAALLHSCLYIAADNACARLQWAQSLHTRGGLQRNIIASTADNVAPLVTVPMSEVLGASAWGTGLHEATECMAGSHYGISEVGMQKASMRVVAMIEAESASIGVIHSGAVRALCPST